MTIWVLLCQQEQPIAEQKLPWKSLWKWAVCHFCPPLWAKGSYLMITINVWLLPARGQPPFDFENVCESKSVKYNYLTANIVIVVLYMKKHPEPPLLMNECISWKHVFILCQKPGFLFLRSDTSQASLYLKSQCTICCCYHTVSEWQRIAERHHVSWKRKNTQFVLFSPYSSSCVVSGTKSSSSGRRCASAWSQTKLDPAFWSAT